MHRTKIIWAIFVIDGSKIRSSHADMFDIQCNFSIDIFFNIMTQMSSVSGQSEWNAMSFYLTTRLKSYLTPKLSLSTLKIIEIDWVQLQWCKISQHEIWKFRKQKFVQFAVDLKLHLNYFFLPHFDCSVSALMVNTKIYAVTWCVSINLLASAAASYEEIFLNLLSRSPKND